MLAWITDENGNLVAEQGDNAQTLSTFLGVDYSEALNILEGQGYVTEGQFVSNIEAGEKLELNNQFTRDLAANGKLPSGSIALRYNCWGSAVFSVLGSEISVGVGIDLPSTFDRVMQDDFIAVNGQEAQFGKTILRFSSNAPYSGPGFNEAVAKGDVSRDPN